jgi:hypothetical protein
MANLTMSAFDNILKEFYLPLFEEQFNRQTVLMDEVILKRDSEHVEGKNAYIGVEWETLGGTDSIAEGGTLPTPEPGDYNRLQIGMKYHYARFRITGPVIDASANDPGAFAPALQREMKSKITSFLRHANRMMMGDSSGALARVDDGSPDTTLGVDAAYGIADDNNGTLFFTPNMNVGFYSAKTGGTARGAARITAVNKSTNIITINALPSGTSNNDFITRELSSENEMMGLLGIIDTSDFVTTLQNINGSTETRWQAQKRQGSSAGTNEALTLLRMQLLWDDVTFQGGGTPKFLLGSSGTALTYAMMAKRENITVNKMTLDGGWSGLDFNGQAPVIADVMCPKNRLFYIDPSTLRLYELTRPQWLDRGTGVLKQVGDTDVFQATYQWYAELGVSNRGKNGVLEDITELS